MLKKLNKQQKLFCEYYIECFNGHHAACQAGYSKSCATQIASRMLTWDNINTYINELLDARKHAIDIQTAEIIRELKTIAFNPLERSTNRLKALEMLGKYKHIWNDNKTIIVNNNPVTDLTEEQIEEQLKRLDNNE
jgi:phage terminase small subunit